MKNKFLPLVMIGACMTSCFSLKVTDNSTSDVVPAPKIGQTVASSNAYVIPTARIYKIYGKATVDNVPVQVSTTGEIISFPAPTDIKGQEPLAMVDGYLLDRRGIGENTRFLRWTYKEYEALKQAPSIAELKAAIIPDAGVKSIHVLDLTLSQALADTAAVNAEILKKY